MALHSDQAAQAIALARAAFAEAEAAAACLSPRLLPSWCPLLKPAEEASLDGQKPSALPHTDFAAARKRRVRLHSCFSEMFIHPCLFQAQVRATGLLLLLWVALAGLHG